MFALRYRKTLKDCMCKFWLIPLKDDLFLTRLLMEIFFPY